MAEGTRYNAPNRAAGPNPVGGPAAGVTIRGLEVTQVVQDLQNSVRLVAGKDTFVRVYLDPQSVAAAAKVAGELMWRRGGGENYLPAINAVTLDPADPSSDLHRHRGDAALSLNFRLPAEAVADGHLSVRLNRLYVSGGADLPLGAPANNAGWVTVNFVKMPPFRIRVIGLRYRAPGAAKAVAPSAVHFQYLRSFLQRAYPVASLEWSHIVVDADFSAPFDDDTVVKANKQVAAIRALEVGEGADPRTHYYGLVDDYAGAHFMRGRAHAIPSLPRPDVVASGPAGIPGQGFGGDFDASYADWYGAHELGHTLGRYHPGFPPGQQDASDAVFPYPNGCISTADKAFAGFDVGDATLGLRECAMPGLQCHDIMTYAERQWLSKYTYEAIADRLLAEDAIS